MGPPYGVVVWGVYMGVYMGVVYGAPIWGDIYHDESKLSRARAREPHGSWSVHSTRPLGRVRTTLILLPAI